MQAGTWLEDDCWTRPVSVLRVEEGRYACNYKDSVRRLRGWILRVRFNAQVHRMLDVLYSYDVQSAALPMAGRPI